MNFAVIRSKIRIEPILTQGSPKSKFYTQLVLLSEAQHYAALRTKQSILTTVTKPVEVWCFLMY